MTSARHLRVLIASLLSAALVSPATASDEKLWRAGGFLPPPLRDDDFHDNGGPPPARVELGRVLMFDPILSGNRNVSCATCHHPQAGTGDGRSLPVGVDGQQPRYPEPARH